VSTVTLQLRVVGPRGLIAEKAELDEVTVRRREARFDPGSQVAVRPRHAPLLMQTCAGELTWRRGSREGSISLGRGVLEVLDDHVTVVITD
jgi:F0F1-type ATP synthase epsilon subunit